MRKLIMFNLITLDGFFEGPNHELDWHNVDEEINVYSIQQLQTAGAILFGRVTYQMMANYWPTSEGLRDDPIVAGMMNDTPKFVFSNTLDIVAWKNTTLIKGEAGGAIAKLKQQPGKDMFIFGSGGLVSYLAQHDLIDEYRLIIAPIFLGQGNPMFKNQNGRIQLKLIKTRVFSSGNVLLYYQPMGKE